MTKSKNSSLTPWLQDALADFQKNPSEQTLKEMLASPFPQKIKSALRDAYKKRQNNFIIAVPRKQDIQKERNLR